MKTFAVIGLGRFGTSVAESLFGMGCEVLAIDKSLDRVNYIADRVTRAMCADAKDESVLGASGIRNYDCAVVAIGNDLADSVLVTLHLKEMGIKKVVCKARDSQHKKILEKIGADAVIIPELEAGVKLAASLASDRLMDLIDLSDEYSIADCIVPKDWVGKSIDKLSVRKKYGVNIIAVKSASDENAVNITPPADYCFKDTDIAVLLGRIEDINKLTDI